MKILILLEKATIGGHVLSALTAGKELKKRGHDVAIVAGYGSYAPEIRKTFELYEIPFFYEHSKRQTYFTWGSLRTVRALAEVTAGRNFDLIHSFDSRSYIVATLFNLFYQPIPLACTICGGVAPYYNLPHIGKLIVFSPEQKKKMIERYGWNPGHVAVIRSRLDMDQFAVADTEVDALCRGYGIEPNGNNIMMITTFLGPKVKPVKNVLEAMEIVLKKNPDFRFIMIGAKGDFYEDAKKIGGLINERLQREAILFTGKIVGAYRLLKAARIVLGQGRSAFEGMAFSKPTLIVGDLGYAGTVCEESIDDLAYYNFSGRNNKALISAADLADAIQKLIENRDYYEQVGRFGRAYVEKNIAITAHIAEIEKAYLTNMKYYKEESYAGRFLNLCKIMAPIMIDNYYNQLKRFIFK